MEILFYWADLSKMLLSGMLYHHSLPGQNQFLLLKINHNFLAIILQLMMRELYIGEKKEIVVAGLEKCFKEYYLYHEFFLKSKTFQLLDCHQYNVNLIWNSYYRILWLIIIITIYASLKPHTWNSWYVLYLSKF